MGLLALWFLAPWMEMGKLRARCLVGAEAGQLEGEQWPKRSWQ